jgi:hypothetical protein
MSAILPALAAATLLLSTPAAAKPLAKPPPAHPDVASKLATSDCAGCHAQATPAVAREWEESPHGLALVKCLACHGSTGKDFTLAPQPERCRACHAAEVASVTPATGKPRACFSCHAPHTLRADAESPHAK